MENNDGRENKKIILRWKIKINNLEIGTNKKTNLVIQNKKKNLEMENNLDYKIKK